MGTNTTEIWSMDDTTMPSQNMTSHEASNTSSSGFTPEDLSKYSLYNAGKGLLSVQIIVCCAIGLPSNLASIVTLLKMKPMTSSTFFLTLLAFVDFSTLFYKQLFSILIADIQHRVSETGCKFYFYVTSILVHYSIWLMVALTVERFIAVWLPLKVANICTVHRAKVVSLCILIVLAFFNLPFALAATERQLSSGRWNCGIHADYGSLIQSWVWVDSTIYVFASWPILLVCNLMIIIGLRMSVRRKQRLTNSSNQSEEARRQHLSVTIMLVANSVTCFILITPNAIFSIYERYWDYGSDIEQYAIYIFVNSFVYFMSNLNQSVNFWLYVVSGRRFRNVFIAILTCQDTDLAQRSKTSGVQTALSNVSRTTKGEGEDNKGYEKSENNHI